MRQSSSDPLPYVQVDRAVKPRAAMLADTIGVSRQHAMGSLIEWWDLCGDPRELERIVEQTPPGEEPAVILTADDAALRFRLASTREVEPITLARIGLLEELGGGRFRVRGMSRYFDPVIRRVQAREAAAKGGKASVETRRKSTGSAQPAGGRGSAGGSEVASEVAQATTEAEPKRNRSDNRSDNRSGTEATTEAEPKPSGQRSAVSGQLFAVAAAGPASIDDFWPAAQDERTRVAGLVRETPPHPRDLSAWQSEAMSEVGGDLSRLWQGYLAFLADPFWRLDAKRKCAWRGWVLQWRGFLPAAPGAGPQPTRPAKPTNTRAPVAAESVDWSAVTPGEVVL